MKKGLTELVFILDRSGSMGGLEKDTIGGFNSMLERQKKEAEEKAGQVEVTTVLFDDRYEMIHDRFPMDVVKPMTEKEYYVRGCTALLDAVGRTIANLQNIQEHLPEDHRAEKVIFVITTDGLENASREYTYARLKQMIERQKELGWDFLFLGANMDAVAEASRFGIASDRAVTYMNDSQGVALNYAAVSDAISEMRMAPCCAAVGAAWKSEIEQDVKARSGRSSRQGGASGSNPTAGNSRTAFAGGPGASVAGNGNSRTAFAGGPGASAAGNGNSRTAFAGGPGASAAGNGSGAASSRKKSGKGFWFFKKR